jgi:hypothetical protein
MKRLVTRQEIMECDDIHALKLRLCEVLQELHAVSIRSFERDTNSSWEHERYSQLLREQQDRERNGYMNGG